MPSRLIQTLFAVILLSLSACKVDDEIERWGPDLTRNKIGEESWLFRIVAIDSVSKDGKGYFSDPPTKFNDSYDYNFWLERLKDNPRKYLRKTWHSDNEELYNYKIFTDTIEVRADLNDSIICKIYSNDHLSTSPDTPGISPWTFHGKYNKKTRMIVGTVSPFFSYYRCPTCPGHVYYLYSGPRPAVIIEFQ